MFITRRFVLAAAALGANFSPRVAVWSVLTECVGGSAMRLRALVPAPGSAREIGRIYLAQYPAEDSIASLTRLILASMSLASGDVAALDHETLPAMVTSRVRADFEYRFTVDIDGWILSRTEARLCALWT
jgi:hypothetical protein